MTRRNCLYASLLAFGLLFAAAGRHPAAASAGLPSRAAAPSGPQGRRIFLSLITGGQRNTGSPPNGPIYWGVDTEGAPGDMNRLSAWERDVAGKGVSILHWGHAWDNNGGYRAWTNKPADDTRGHGAIPMISWNPEGGDQTRWQLQRIINGEHDGYIREFAAGAKAWGYPLLLRMMHEMNGAWGYPWQEDSNGNHRGEFVPAWRHIVDIFRQAGATNVSFIWCVNKEYPNSPNPTYASLYPGSDYVDWTCVDGYNWGANRPEGWERFDQVFDYSYNEVLRVAPNKPMMIGEFGSAEQGGSKADWITDALGQVANKYRQVRALVYFNWINQGVDWRLESSSASASAWRRGISSPYFAANQFGGLTGKPATP